MSGQPLTNDQINARMLADLAAYQQRMTEQEDWKRSAVSAEIIANKATELNAWLYLPSAKTWFTPDEFLQKYRQFYLNHPVFLEVKIKHPIEGINAGNKHISSLQEKLIAFSRKVIEYYQSKR